MQTVATATNFKSEIDAIAEVFRDGVTSYCERMLEVGRLSQELVAAEHAATGHSTGIRLLIGRRLATITGKPVNVHRMISIWWVTQLLGDRGDMIVAHLREFVPCLTHDYAGADWSLPENKKIHDRIQAIYNQAREEHWIATRIRNELDKAFPIATRPRQQKRNSKKQGNQDGMDKENPLATVKTANPKDAVEVIRDLILNHEKSATVVRLLATDRTIMQLLNGVT